MIAQPRTGTALTLPAPDPARAEQLSPATGAPNSGSLRWPPGPRNLLESSAKSGFTARCPAAFLPVVAPEPDATACRADELPEPAGCHHGSDGASRAGCGATFTAASLPTRRSAMPPAERATRQPAVACFPRSQRITGRGHAPALRHVSLPRAAALPAPHSPVKAVRRRHQSSGSSSRPASTPNIRIMPAAVWSTAAAYCSARPGGRSLKSASQAL